MTQKGVKILDQNEDTFRVTAAITEACLEAKGREITILGVEKVFDLSDYFVVVSGRSDRQVIGIANRILSDLEEQGQKPYSVEGLEDGHWVLIDYGETIVHIFYEPMREHYDIEGLWINAKRTDIEDDSDLEKLLRAA